MAKRPTVTVEIPPPVRPEEISSVTAYDLDGRCNKSCPFLAHGDPCQYCTQGWAEPCGKWSVQPGIECPVRGELVPMARTDRAGSSYGFGSGDGDGNGDGCGDGFGDGYGHGSGSGSGSRDSSGNG